MAGAKGEEGLKAGKMPATPSEQGCSRSQRNNMNSLTRRVIGENLWLSNVAEEQASWRFSRSWKRVS